MNESTIDMNETFYIKIGSSGQLQDSLYLYLYIPFGIGCVLLDLLTLLMLQSKKIQKNTLNSYIKIHAFICMLVCVMLLFKGLVSVPRYFSFSYSLPSRIFSCKIYVFAISTLIFMANSLNVIIIIERLSMFVIKYKRFHSKHPYRHTLILLVIISLLINLVLYFQQETKSDKDFNNYRYNYSLILTLQKCDTTKFGETVYAKFGITISFLIDNFVILIIEIIATLKSVKYLKLYIKHKISLIHMNHQRRCQFGNRNEIYELSIIDPNNQNHQNDQQIDRLIYELNSNVTRFIISFNVFCVITNILSVCIFFVLAIFLINYFRLSLFGVFFYDIMFLVKHGSLFFFFIGFNRNFRKQFFDNFNHLFSS